MELIFGVSILALSALLAYEKYESRKERTKLVNALIAKTPQELRDLTLAEKVESIKPPVKTAPEFIPESELDDQQFKELIQKEVA